MRVLLMAGVAGAIIAFIGYGLILHEIFNESTLYGFLSLFVPCIALLYVLTEWQTCKRGALMLIGGGILVAIARSAQLAAQSSSW